MALVRDNSSSYITTITDNASSTGNEYRVSSSVNDNRVFSVNIYFTKGQGETTSPTYTEAAKKALHDAIVAVLMNELYPKPTNDAPPVGIGYGI